MVIDCKKRNIFFILGIVLISLFCIKFADYANTYALFWGDDAWYSLYLPNEGFFDCLDFNCGHGGGYIGYFLSKFLSFGLPNLLAIHPSDFISDYHGIIKGIFIVFVCLFLTKFSFLFVKSKYIFLSLFFIIVICFFYLTLNSLLVNINYNFYRYIFSIIFLSIVLLYFYKNLNEKYSKINYFKLILAAISAFIAGSAVEIVSFPLLLFSGFIILYNFVINILIKLNKEKDFFKSLKYNLGITFYIPFISLSSAVFLFTKSPGFRAVASERGMSDIHINCQIISEFFALFKNNLFDRIWFFWILFCIILVFCFYKSYKNNELKKIIFPLLYMISLLSVLFSLILCGKTLLGDDGYHFFIEHGNIIGLSKLLFLIPFLINFGYCLQFLLKNKYSKYTFLYLILPISLICSCLSINSIMTYYKDALLTFKDLKQKRYICEKILRFCYLQNKVPELPKEWVLKNFIEWTYSGGINDFYNGEDSILTASYYLRIYKDETAKDIGFKLTNNALDKFYSLGGIITDEELNDIKFKRLFDKDFVLNKKS